MEATPEQLLDVHAEISKNAVRLVEGITADQWTEPTPCSEWDVRALVNHMAGTSKVLTASARREAPTSEPNDENLGDDPIASFTAAIAGAEAAWRAPEALAGEVNVPFDMPAVAALGVNLTDDHYKHITKMLLLLANPMYRNRKLNSKEHYRIKELFDEVVPPA